MDIIDSIEPNKARSISICLFSLAAIIFPSTILSSDAVASSKSLHTSQSHPPRLQSLIYSISLQSLFSVPDTVFMTLRLI